jgi:hypothetical protein
MKPFSLKIGYKVFLYVGKYLRNEQGITSLRIPKLGRGMHKILFNKLDGKKSFARPSNG